nr:hypothetical protein [Variovorax boronicumulans]
MKKSRSTEEGAAALARSAAGDRPDPLLLALEKWIVSMCSEEADDQIDALCDAMAFVRRDQLLDLVRSRLLEPDLLERLPASLVGLLLDRSSCRPT